MLPPPGAIRLTLYARSYCHLCDDLLAALEACRAWGDFTVDVIDVDSAPDWEERFGERVPVLTFGDTEICHYFLDEARLREVLGAIR